MIALVAAGASGANLPATHRITSVVRADARSGRLVRSISVTSQPVTAKVVPTVVVNPVIPGKAQPEPASVSELVEQIARRHDVEPVLVDSMIRVESNYNPFAVSH